MFCPGCNQFEKHFGLLVIGALRANHVIDAQFVSLANHHRWPRDASVAEFGIEGGDSHARTWLTFTRSAEAISSAVKPPATNMAAAVRMSDSLTGALITSEAGASRKQ